MASTSSMSLEQLVALNDEIAALTRAGVPLPDGLRQLSRELPGQLGRHAAQLSAQLRAGRPLDQAVRELGERFAPVYSAVVLAGMRSGRLPSALESLSRTLRRLADIRRSFSVAMLYPLIVLLVASGLLLFSLSRPIPIMLDFYQDFELRRPAIYEFLLTIAFFFQHTLPWIWLVAAILLGWWLYRSSRATALLSARGIPLPALARVAQAGRMATFTEILALLVEHDVPLDEALVVSATASGDARLARGGQQLAEQVRQGNTAAAVPPGIPPLIGWLILGHAQQARMAETLRRAAGTYHRRIHHWGIWLGIYLPILLSAVIGGLVTLFYALLMLTPFYSLLQALS